MKKLFCLLLFCFVFCAALTGCKSETVSADAYYLVIGEENVIEITISTPKENGGVSNADGSLFKKGEKVILEQLEGLTSLRGVTIIAVNEAGEPVYAFHIPDNADDGDITKLVLGDTWLVAPTRN